MTRLSLLNSPLLLGFDDFERTLERIAKAPTEGYPPYNIERTGEETLRITLAVAGFEIGDLDIQLEDSQLTVRGRQRSDGEGRVFLHRGIATRQFQRSFVLADGVQVTDAQLDNGLLHVDLHLPRPQRDVRTIEIRKSSANRGSRTIDVPSGND
jgi:HSP20 family molecular chaperone IbpA